MSDLKIFLMLLLGLTSGEGQEGTRKEREGEGEEREKESRGDWHEERDEIVNS